MKRAQRAMRESSELRRREQAAMRQVILRLKRQHKIDHPDCAYGDEPHFVPPSFGDVGFYLCDVPADLTNHSRDWPEGSAS